MAHVCCCWEGNRLIDWLSLPAGPNGATFASSLATTKYTSSFGNLNLLAGVAGAAAAGTLARSESAEALKRAKAGMAQVLKLESIASSAVR